MKINFNYIYILFIFVVSFIVTTWFGGDYFILGGDYLPIFHPVKEFIQDIHIWLPLDPSGLGADTRALPEIFPYELLTALGHLSGFSVIYLQKILFYTFMCVSGLSMFLLVYLIFQNFRNRSLAAFFAALFYMLNTYTLFFKWPDRVQSLFAYIFFPLVLALYIKGINKNNNNFLYSIGIALLFLLMSPAVTTPTYLLIIVIVLSLYYLFYNSFNFSFTKWKQSTLFSIKSIVLIILFNFWWVMPYLYNIVGIESGSKAFQVAKSLESFKDTLEINSSDSSFLNIFRLMGYWALDAKHGCCYYYPILLKVYTSLSFICISTLIPIVVFGSSLIKTINQKIKNLILFFLLLSMGSLFFINGVHEPFGNINKWLFFNWPFFSMFRSQYEKIGAVLVLGYSVLFGFVISYIYSYFKNISKFLGKIFIIAVFIIFFIVNMFPFWTGDNIQEKRGDLSSQRVKVPSFYVDTYGWVSKFFLNQRLLVFPLSVNRSGNIRHRWGEANGNILSKLFNKPVIIKSFFGKSDKLNNDFSLMIRSFPFLNIQYIFIDNSRAPNTYNQENLKQINRSILDTIIKPVKEIGQLKFYKISSHNFLQHFYTPQNIITTNQTIGSLPKIVSTSDYNVRSAIYFDEQNKKIPTVIVNKSSTNIALFNDIKNPVKISVSLNRNYIYNDRYHDFKRHINQDTRINIKYSAQEQKIILGLVSNQLQINSQKIRNNSIRISAIPAKIGDVLKIGDQFIRITHNLNQKISFAKNIELYNTTKQLSVNSFEQGLWQDKVGDCSDSMLGRPRFNMQLSNDSTDGEHSLELGSKNHYACVSKTIPVQIKSDKYYQLSFDYKNLKGDDIQYYYKLRGDKYRQQEGYAFAETFLAKNHQWNKFSTIIDPTIVRENFITPEYNPEIEKNKSGGFDAHLLSENRTTDLYSGDPIKDIKYIDIFFYAPSDGTKEIINKFDNIKLKELEFVKSHKIEIDNEITIQENIKLKEKNEIEYIDNLKQFNLFENSSFENGLWNKKANDCSDSMSGKPDLSMKLSNDSTDGEHSLELGSKNHYACSSKSFPVKLSKNKIYKYSFDYKNVAGDKVNYYYNLKGKEKFYPFSEILEPENHDWNHYETLIEPEEDISNVDLFFYAPSGGSKKVINRYDNIRLEEWMPKDLFNYYLYSEAEEEIKTPMLEFRKVNPIKYVVRVHQASESFPLVFSESFHQGWKAYVSQPAIQDTAHNMNLADYKILDGNQDDQASQNELAEFIQNGWVTSLGDGKEKKIEHKKWEDGKEKLDYIEEYKIDFVSKNFQDTIQNDNLPKGRFYETYFKKPLPEENHLMANGYANSWWVDMDEIKKSGQYIQNPDGSIDFELVVEFWPQRLFYLGLLISGVTLLGCIGYLVYDWRKRKNRNKEIEKLSN